MEGATLNGLHKAARILEEILGFRISLGFIRQSIWVALNLVTDAQHTIALG